jgi:hypothetical protein
MIKRFNQAQVSFIAVAKYCFRAHYFSSSILGSNQTDLNSSKSSGENTIEAITPANTTGEGTNNYQDDQADDVQPSTSKLQCRG